MNGQRLSYSDIARVCGTGLISTGIGLLLFAFITVVWGDPFTRISEHKAQARLEQQFAKLVSKAPLADTRLDPRLTRSSARRYKRSLSEGEAAAELRIAKIGLHKYVVKGATQEALAEGPGFYEETGFPGSGLPVAIAGHRTTHGAPFLNIDKLSRGDAIVLDLPYARFTYTVTRTKIIAPTDWSIIQVGAAQPGSGSRCASGTCEHLVMTACHPKYSAKQRIAVFAALTKVQLRRQPGRRG